MTLEKETVQMFINVLKKLPSSFSSIQFFSAARKDGVPDSIMRGRAPGIFLKENCGRLTDRTWIKRLQAPSIFDAATPDAIHEAARLLKANGYRVMKRVDEWAEV